ncbi:MAG: dihydrodipicolinate synthase family protein [Candidatus Tectomicrobia bacterium]|uniref:Dihydrodipicolinate synthase family protein n=1 Tax=Tectimicrobiota bacterium TaxID=2528274 RepID=A0A932MNN2_UNCTE|nr:dihydrodipicolinate synthase family protein [Candidatus Tectomicrobia bacterium]
MKYRKSEAKEYAREALRGIWDSVGTPFTPEGKLDEAGIRRNMNHLIENLQVDGNYTSGNVAEFWSLSTAERKRAHEAYIEAAAGRIPMMAGVHDQSADTAVELARHAQDVGYDLVIILTPFIAARNDAAVLEYMTYVSQRVDIGIVLFNSPGACHLIGPELARRLAALPNVCGMKQTDWNPHATILLEEAVGDRIVISVAEETVWLHNMIHLGHRWLITYTPHTYQVAGWLPLKEYTELALAGDLKRAAEVSASLAPLRAANSRWIMGPWAQGRMPVAALKLWEELIGMAAGPVRPPAVPLTKEEREELRADLRRAGLLQKAEAATAPQ